MGVYDEADHPWLAAEKRFIAEAVLAGKPYWGVCLGAQLLAASLGAGVAPGRMPEVGVLSVELTANAARDPVFAGAPASFKAFQWHSDTYELPDGAIRLAGSAQYEQQAFVFARAYALQFHLEVTPALVAEWVHVSAYANSLDRLSAGVDKIALLIAQLASAAPYTTALARELFGRWLMHIARVSATVEA